MISESTVTVKAKNFIQQKLGEIVEKHNVKILLAVESGSRAWGFPSTNSDYDVRFIYARSTNDYLSVKQYRDVIETDILENDFLGVPLDLNGWDFRKALQLAIKSNAVLIEWLQSPIRYMVDAYIINHLLEFVQATTDLESIKNHYYKLAINVWKQIEENEKAVKLKLYCYALRPVLALQWVCRFDTLPPMDVHSLIKGLVKDVDLYENISDLIVLKATAQENDIIRRNCRIDSFIASMLVESYDVSRQTIHNEKYLKVDKLFRKIIG